MADDVMDSSERAEAALAAFSGDDSVGENADQQANDQTNAGTQDQGGSDQQNAREHAAANDAQQGKLSDEQLNADPRFQELSSFRDDVSNALRDFPGLVGEDGKVNLQEASLQLKDASILYDIMQGKGSPSGLLDIMAQNAGWNDQQKQLIANDLIQWLTKAGYLKGGQGADGKNANADPVAQRLDKLENERRSERQQAEQQRVQAHQKEVFEKKFLPEVERLCKQKQLPQEDFAQYVGEVAGRVRGNKAILDRIEKGNYVDIQKFFSEIYNKEAQRIARWTKAQTAAAQKKNQNPRIPAGGASPNPAGSAKAVNVKSRDDRIAAASELL